jgi:uncharacterized protein (DUF1499 family)
MKTLAVSLALLLVVGYLIFFAMLAVRSRRAPRLEVRDGRLKACARPSNCVNTQDAGGGFQPLRYSGPPAAAWQRLRAAVTGLPRTKVLAEADVYLRVEVASAIFGFRDDLEALLDPQAGVIHLRSASRVGLRDRGVNGRRIERVRQRFEGGGGQ